MFNIIVYKYSSYKFKADHNIAELKFAQKDSIDHN